MKPAATGAWFKIKLPAAQRPSWFVNQIELKPGFRFIIVDDQDYAGLLWQRRLKSSLVDRSIGGVTFDPNILRVYSVQDFEATLHQILSQPDIDNAIFLIDYQLEDRLTGLDLIHKYGLNRFCTVLVTNYHDDLGVRQRVAELGIKLLPKNFISQMRFPILVDATSRHTSEHQ
jgi:hypothetical protein